MKLAKKFTKTPPASSNCDNWKWHTTSQHQDVTHCQCYNKKICLKLCEVSCFCTQHNKRRDFRWRLPRLFPQTETFQSISIICPSIKRMTEKRNLQVKVWWYWTTLIQNNENRYPNVNTYFPAFTTLQYVSLVCSLENMFLARCVIQVFEWFKYTIKNDEDFDNNAVCHSL